jgi:hypothetical protein
MADESKSNHLVLLNLLEIKIIVSCAVHIYNSKTQFHPIESLYLNQTWNQKYCVQIIILLPIEML